MNSDCLEKEIRLIQNQEISQFVKDYLNQVPEYFFHVAASSTGKYHPTYALGEGGLLRHTQAATRIAYELFRTDMFPYNKEQQDLILASLIMHDTYKHGINGSAYTITEHPLVAADMVNKCSATLNPKWREIISQNISTHMRKMDAGL